jgi:hypothetical protein
MRGFCVERALVRLSGWALFDTLKLCPADRRASNRGAQFLLHPTVANEQPHCPVVLPQHAGVTAVHVAPVVVVQSTHVAPAVPQALGLNMVTQCPVESQHPIGQFALQ